MTPYLAVVTGFLAALALATVTSSLPRLSLVGEYFHYAGLVGYAAYLVVSLVVVRAFRTDSSRLLLIAATIGAAVVVVYGLLQVAGLDPLDWQTYEFAPIASTLGNSNVAAGYLGITAPAVLWAALTPTLAMRWRLAAAALFAALAFLAVATASFQGPVAVVAGTIPVVGAWWLEHRPLRRMSRGVRIAGVTGFLVVGALAAPRLLGAVVSGVRGGFTERVFMWKAALRIFADHPFLGSGLDTFGQNFFAYRPAEHAVRFGASLAETPHSVPLAMLSNGGIVLAAAYLAVVGYVAWILIRGLAATDGEHRLLLAGFGGMWLAYQVQSLVSFDVPPLAFLHWVAAGAIVTVATSPRLREIRLPGRPVAPSRGRSRSRSRVPAGTRATHGAIVVVAVVGLWFSLQPLRADVAAASGVSLAKAGNVESGLVRLQEATRLAPYRGRYWAFHAAVLDRVGQPELAREAAIQGALRNPGEVELALAAAQLAVKTGSVGDALHWYEDAVGRDPRNPNVLAEAGQFYQEHGNPDRAAELFAQAASVAETDSALWLALAKAQAEAGEHRAAEDAYERVLQLDPDNTEARAALAAGAR